MPDVTVHPHGDRWAVREARANSPLEEFETRAAAESAAQRLAAGGRVEVLDEDPTGLAAAQRSGDADADDPPPRQPVDGLRERERLRTEQGGL
jgi:Uncharacterized protein conserved in bacteria (DUF2188)